MLDLAASIVKKGTDIEVHALDTSGTDIPSQGIEPQLHAISGRFPFPHSADMRKSLARDGIDLMHVHGLWSFPSLAVPKIGMTTGAPWIISPHGMLDPWALQNSRWKKQIARLLFENRHLEKASCLHALCESEAESIRSIGLTNPICTIPNGVQLPNISRTETQREIGPNLLLFLGRLHPKKGLENALRAWRSLETSRRAGWNFVIAGWDQGGHEAELKDLCDELEIVWNDQNQGTEFLDRLMSATGSESQVFFPGPFFGNEKARLLQSANAFILPSFSEGLPMAVLEAWAYELPVVLTKHCNLEIGLEYNAAISVETEPISISNGLDELFSLSDAQRSSMGKAGRDLVANHFSWDSVAKDMIGVYEWIIGGGPAPPCVVEE